MGHSLFGENRGIMFALIGSVILFVFQIVAFYFTNILILLAGSFDTLSDILISGFLLASVVISRKAANRLHMFGYGRVQNVAAMMISTIFVFVLSLETFRAAIPRFFTPEAQTPPEIMIGIGVSLMAIAIYAVPFLDLLRTKRKGAADKAQMYAALEMEITFSLSAIGIFFVSLGYYWVDSLIAVAIGVIIAITGIKLFRDNASYLIGMAPDEKFMHEIRRTALSVPGVLGVHDLTAEYVGPNHVHTGIHIEVARGTAIEKADAISERVKGKIMRETSCKYCFVHVDPKQAH